MLAVIIIIKIWITIYYFNNSYYYYIYQKWEVNKIKLHEQ